MSEIKKIAVIGLGYVGLPLALMASKKGMITVGIDIDDRKMTALNDSKTSYIDGISDYEIENTKAIFSNNAAQVADADAVIVCVPTPVTKDKEPDLQPVRGAISAIAPHMKKGALLVIESTVNPGVCDDIVTPLFEEISGKKIGKDIYLAHCPERINPGDPNWNVSNINRVVGANTKPELNMAVKLYESLLDAEIKPMASLKEAEAVKVVENSFRDINIAFVNELAMSFHKLGINVENVIDGAATKPFAFMPHRPGCGVGGHCIPVDPYYLIDYASGFGFEHTFLKTAREINEHMPSFTVSLLAEALDEANIPLNQARVALLGLSYKANVGDDRESPAYEIKNRLDELGNSPKTYDPYIIDKSTCKSLGDALINVDAVIVATGHEEFYNNLNVETLNRYGVNIVIDGRNLLRDKKNSFADHDIYYSGIGI